MLFAGILSSEEIVYNTVKFNRGMTVDVVEQPLRDDLNKAVIGTVITITVRGVHTQSSSSNILDFDRKKLMIDGKDMSVRNIGILKLAGGSKDIRDGPKTNVLQWKPIGSRGIAAEIVWSVTVTLHACVKDPSSYFIQKGYSVSWEISDAGFTTRVVSGFIEVYADYKRTANGSHHQSAEDFRSNINIDRLLGYRRFQSYMLSPDRRRLNFMVRDQQIESPNPYPDGVAEISGRHTIQWNRSSAGRLDQSISVKIKRTPESKPERSWEIFHQILTTRKTETKDEAPWILSSMNISDDLFGFVTDFSASYWVPARIKDILKKTKLWFPLKLNTWAKWQDYKDAVVAQHGHSRLFFNKEEDIVISCDVERQRELNMKGQQFDADPLFGGIVKQKYKLIPSAKKEEVPKETSYLRYDIKSFTLRKNPVVVTNIIKSYDNTGSDQFDPKSTDSNERPTGKGTVSNVIHQGGQPVVYVGLAGIIERIDFEIPVPQMKVFEGQTVVEVSRDVDTAVISNMNGHAVNQLRFRTLYAVSGFPRKTTIPLNFYADSFKSGIESDIPDQFSV